MEELTTEFLLGLLESDDLLIFEFEDDTTVDASDVLLGLSFKFDDAIDDLLGLVFKFVDETAGLGEALLKSVLPEDNFLGVSNGLLKKALKELVRFFRPLAGDFWAGMRDITNSSSWFLGLKWDLAFSYGRSFILTPLHLMTSSPTLRLPFLKL